MACLRKRIIPVSSCQKSKRPKICSIANAANCADSGIASSGEGNPQGSLMMILDNPGAREDREGNPFLCGTRETLQLGMREAGMDIHSVYVTYLLKRRPTRAYDKPATRAACLPHLQAQLLPEAAARVIWLWQYRSRRIIPAEGECHRQGAAGSWHEFEGIPMGFTYHPLAVRRRPNLLRFFVEDLKGLRAKWEERAGG